MCECVLLPAEHLDVVEGGVVLQRSQLLETQLLTSTIEAIGAVDANVVVVAPGPVLHRTQPWGTLGIDTQLCLFFKNNNHCFFSHSSLRETFSELLKLNRYTHPVTSASRNESC